MTNDTPNLPPEVLEAMTEAFMFASNNHMQAALAVLREQGYVVERDWESIEGAPRDGTPILIAPKYGLPKMIGCWKEWAKGRWGFGFIMGRDVDPTHFRPIPPGPENAT